MGKGPSAAIPVASIICILKEAEHRRLDIKETLQLINQRMIELFDFHITTSVASATVYDDGRCDLVNCGIHGWYLYSEKETKFIMTRSSPLGMSTKVSMCETTIQLKKDELLFTFTDGYMEGSRSLKKFLKDMNQSRNFVPKIEYINEKLLSVSHYDVIEDDQSLLTIRAS